MIRVERVRLPYASATGSNRSTRLSRISRFFCTIYCLRCRCSGLQVFWPRYPLAFARDFGLSERPWRHREVPSVSGYRIIVSTGSRRLTKSSLSEFVLLFPHLIVRLITDRYYTGFRWFPLTPITGTLPPVRYKSISLRLSGE